MNRHNPVYPVLLLILFGLPLVIAEEKPEATAEEEAGKVYRKYHPDGVVEFSDKPLRGGDELKVEEVPTYKFGAPAKATPSPTPSARPPSPPASKSPKLRTKKLTPAGPYSKLAITSPTREQTIRANDGTINVSYTLVPGLQAHNGHQVVYLLDGRSALKTDSPRPLENVDRGTHTLVLQVVDRNKKVLIHSDSVTFHVMRYFKPSSKKPAPAPTEPDFDAVNET